MELERNKADKLKIERHAFTLEYKAEVVRYKKAESLSFVETGKKFDVLPKLVQQWEKLYESGQLTAAVGRRTVSMTAAGTGAALIVSQHLQAYCGRMWRWTKNFAGVTSSCSLTSSLMTISGVPQAPQLQAASGRSWRCSIRGRWAGRVWRPAPLRLGTTRWGSAAAPDAAS